jgi:hypothetical protein
MSGKLNTFVDLIADFPYRSDWVSNSAPGPPGKELAELLVKSLRIQGFEVGSVEALEYGYSIACCSGDRSFEIEVTVDDHIEMRRWNVQCPSSLDTLDWLLGQSDFVAHRTLLTAIHNALIGSDRIRDIRWFPEYEPPAYLEDRNAMSAPVRDAEAPECDGPPMCDRELDGRHGPSR